MTRECCYLTARLSSLAPRAHWSPRPDRINRPAGWQRLQDAGLAGYESGRSMAPRILGREAGQAAHRRARGQAWPRKTTSPAPGRCTEERRSSEGRTALFPLHPFGIPWPGWPGDMGRSATDRWVSQKKSRTVARTMAWVPRYPSYRGAPAAVAAGRVRYRQEGVRASRGSLRRQMPAGGSSRSQNAVDGSCRQFRLGQEPGGRALGDQLRVILILVRGDQDQRS
jgi:hypothetical protein